MHETAHDLLPEVSETHIEPLLQQLPPHGIAHVVPLLLPLDPPPLLDPELLPLDEPPDELDEVDASSLDPDGVFDEHALTSTSTAASRFMGPPFVWTVQYIG